MKTKDILKDTEIFDKDHCRFGIIDSDEVWAVHKENGYTAIERTLGEALANFIKHYWKEDERKAET